MPPPRTRLAVDDRRRSASLHVAGDATNGVAVDTKHLGDFYGPGQLAIHQTGYRQTLAGYIPITPTIQYQTAQAHRPSPATRIANEQARRRHY